MLVQSAGSYTNLAASGQVSKAPGQLLGFYVNSTSSGTIVLTDSAASSGGTAISGTITPAVGFHPYPAQCVNGLYVTLGSTINATFIFAAG
jgi:hypothetical protein